MNFIQSKENQQGLTLVEMMIAMALSLVLVAGTIQIYVSNKQTYRLQEAQSRVQESARYGLEFLTKDVREAGYSGCRPINQMNVQVIASAPTLGFLATNIINGNEATSATVWSPALALPVTVSANVQGGTDVVTIQKGSSCGATLTTNLGTPDSPISIAWPNACNISSGDALMIADCEDAHIFRATSITSVASGSSTQSIPHENTANGATFFCKFYASLPHVGACASNEAKNYNYDAELLQFTSKTYFIRLGAGGRNALWVFDNTAGVVANNPMELVEGVEDMQVRYGIDTDGDDIVNSYAAANAVTDWSQVISVEISLLLETQEDNLTTDSQIYNYNGATVTSPDGRLRRVFTTTVGIRNQVQ